MPHTVTVHVEAEKQLETFPEKHQRQILRRLHALADDPRPSGVKFLSREGAYEVYRVRSGKYRILYGVNDAALVVLAVQFGNRKDVYRNIETVYGRVVRAGAAAPATKQPPPTPKGASRRKRR